MHQRKALGTSERGGVALMVAVALLVRLPGLGSSFWYDEIITLVHSVRLPWNQVFTTYPSPNHHVLYIVLAKLSVSLFGESEVTLRLPAAIAGWYWPPACSRRCGETSPAAVEPAGRRCSAT